MLAIDIGDADAPQRAIDAAVERWARLDIIVHNAAFVPYGPMSEMADETFMRAFDTNVAAGFRFLKHGIDHLAASGSGRLILTSSIAARGPVPAGLAAYGMSKAAIEGFVRGAAVELAPRRITVNAVAPGATLTPSMEHGMSPEAIEGLRRTMPFGRIGSSDDIAGAMLYLASDDGAYVSGHVLVVDGAQSLSRELALDQAGSEV